MRRPFRFIAAMPVPEGPVAEWRDAVRRIEDLGFDAISVSEHVTGGWRFEATTAMTAILGLTSRLRVISLVLVNDLRNPVMLHKAIASMDYLSEGRVMLGLGAGWMPADYRAVGIPFARASERIDRLEESVVIVKRLFTEPSLTFDGRFYALRGAEGLPRPTQLPHPPILIGGGGPRILEVAARHADIIGVHPRLDGRRDLRGAELSLPEDALASKVRLVREALAAAGRDPASVELQLTIYECRITDAPGGATAQEPVTIPSITPEPAARVAPVRLVGPLGACIDRLHELRERYGFSVIKLGAPAEHVAAIVQALAGT